MLKPSPALLSAGGPVHYWWMYATLKTPSISCHSTAKPRTKHARRSQQTRKLSDCCRQKAVRVHSIKDFRHQRNAHASTNPSETSEDSSTESYWHTVPPHKQPTPYDVLSQPPNGPYNKRRFTYLVKLYHPDLSSIKSSSTNTSPESPSTHPSQLPRSIRIQRYHLLVQAHTLLSDPAKRAAYDVHGAGWASVPSISELRRENSPRGFAAARDNRHNTPWHCATWEDWEAWWAREAARRKREDADIFANDFSRPSDKNSVHDDAEKAAWWVSWVHSRRAAQQNFNSWRPNSSSRAYDSDNPQRPLYTSNGLFIILIGFCTLAGAIYEWNRAGKNSKSYLAQLERANLENWAELNRRKDGSRELENRAERLSRFLKDRSEDATFASRIAEQEPEALLNRKAAVEVQD